MRREWLGIENFDGKFAMAVAIRRGHTMSDA